MTDSRDPTDGDTILENLSETLVGGKDYRISDEPWYGRNVLKWASYDLGNTIFSMVVVSLTFVPLLQILYFEQGYTAAQAINRGNFSWSIILLISNVTMAIISPFLGAYADQLVERKGMLMRLSMLCITFMSALVVSAFTSNVILILAIFLFANLFYSMGLVVYDSMIPFITDKEYIGKVSGFGVALGYFGSIIGIGLAFALTPFFGDFEVDAKANIFDIGYIPYIYPIAGLLFLMFALPMYTVREKVREMPKKETDVLITEVTNNVKSTGIEIFNYRDMLIFLIGWLIFVDAANTIIGFMSTMVQVGLEVPSSTAVQIVLGIGIIAAVVFTYPVGLFVDKYGPRRGLMLITTLWLISMAIAFFTNYTINGQRTPVYLLYVFPIFVGPALGGTWVVQRQYITELAPPSRVANYFGFSNIFGKISAALGPFIWSLSIYMFNQGFGFNINHATRYAIIVLAGLMIIGFIIILQVDDVHEVFLKGGRATGRGTWEDSDGNQLYPPEN